MDLTHASFFSGVGGLDLGLERAGWRTVSFSEIDPYASAVLAERWPGVPNLGDITALVDAPSATLWSGGFPCQDLSVAGKRRGLAGARSGLAYAFLTLVDRSRPRFVLLENVPGLLSSHRGRDMAALVGLLVELGYGVGYRILDARYFGVPQRRRRVFILGDALGGRAGAERAAEVLSVGSRCPRHPPAGGQARARAAARARGGADLAGSLDTSLGHHGNAAGSNQSVDAGHIIQSITASQERLNVPGDQHYVVGAIRAEGKGYPVSREQRLVLGPAADPGGVRAAHGLARGMDDRVELDPQGLDSHRYRCCGNGVVADVSEWIGLRLAAHLDI